MGQLDLNGRVTHMVGPWGTDRSCANAEITVIDMDLDGTHDSIWSGRTGGDGRFAGRTSDWQDKTRVWVPFPLPGKFVDGVDPSDVLSLVAKVKQNGKERAMQAAQMSGDCNSCHTQDGLMSAPGRIVAP